MSLVHSECGERCVRELFGFSESDHRVPLK